MDPFNQVARHTKNAGVTHKDSLRLFESLDHNARQLIFRVKHNDPDVTELELSHNNELSSRASRRLGEIIGQSTNLEVLTLWYCNVDATALCAGLQNNVCIEELVFLRLSLQDAERMMSLAPFFINNPSLSAIDLVRCNIGLSSLNILASALSNRTEDTLEKLDLYGNNFGDIHFDRLVFSLAKCTNLWFLRLSSNGIGIQGCTSLAKLLEDEGSNLTYLDLYDNDVNDEALVTMTEALAKNAKTKLRTLDLGGNPDISSAGFAALLKLVCNCSSVKGIEESNHTLQSLVCNFLRALRVDDANLLRACLRLNEERNKSLLVARSKIIWSHARGDINLGDSFINAEVSTILAWFGDDSNESNAELIQYHRPLLPTARINAIRLDSVYRILRSKPDLCKARTHLSSEKWMFRAENIRLSVMLVLFLSWLGSSVFCDNDWKTIDN